MYMRISLILIVMSCNYNFIAPEITVLKLRHRIQIFDAFNYFLSSEKSSPKLIFLFKLVKHSENKLLNTYIITGTLINRYESFMPCRVIIHIIYCSLN